MGGSNGALNLLDCFFYKPEAPPELIFLLNLLKKEKIIFGKDSDELTKEDVIQLSTRL